MSITATTTVRDLALQIPNAARLFEKIGIDYCCGGTKTLAEACASAHLSADEVLKSLTAADSAAGKQEDRDWQAQPLAELVAYIINKHHKYTREEIARLGPLLDKVCAAHDRNHAELLQIRDLFQGLSQELFAHMMKEEMILFPYIVRMEEAVAEGAPVMPPPFGTVQNPVAMMVHEHDSAGAALKGMRQSSAGYAPPEDACASFRTLYKALEDFEADLHQHIHLENNILFPRAIEMEGSH
jgi:regulator of cell morphogenesis and NO signaling